ncbi:MAG: transporter substrate-binding domain-containing protein [Treponema sp.]|nr:transporter substrate-binding domain-containing protein [Treponema sp.]
MRKLYFSGNSLLGTVLRTVLVCLLFQACTDFGFKPNTQGKPNNVDPQDSFPVYASYRDIPGVTQEEINAIEEFRKSGRTFVYGAYLTSECFNDAGNIGGFGALFCQWLSDLFDIKFIPVIYEWTDLLNGLEEGTIDFTGELTATPERLTTYLMTSTIAQRTVIITTITHYPDPAAVSTWRRPRFGYLSNSVTHSMIQPTLSFEVETIYVDSVEEAYRLLREDKIDAFIEDGYEGAAAIQNDLTIEELIPSVYNPVSMATRNAELAPIISVVQKYLDQGALHHLVNMYNLGYKEYFTYCFHASLNEEEKAYIADHDGTLGKVKPIPFIMEKDNYPWAFYDKTEDAWQGIAWDVIKRIEAITGLQFEVVSTRNDTWSDNLAQLERGDGAFVSKLIRTSERKGHFLWNDVPYATDNFALLSKQETPDVGINEILYSRVGLLANSAYTEYFPLWFPNHPNTVIFPTRAEALKALDKGEIDLYMGTRDTILNLTNYMEEPGYKVNLMFYQTANSHFGFNINEEILCSIINKAQVLVNTELLENRWLSRTFDYRYKLIRQRQPYLIGFSAALGVIVFLLLALLHKYKESKHHLKVLVKRRTRELEIQKDAAQTAYKVKNRFMANMGHELRTPLNAIIGLSQAELERASPESKENLSSINNSGSVLLGIINDLLDISNIESGDMQLKPADYSLPLFISNAAASTKLKINNKKIELQIEADEHLPVKLHGDEHRVKQILGNLLSNAVKFTNEGAIILRIGFIKPENEDEIILYFEVCDTGIGIQNEHMEKLFTDYSQADTETSRSTGGAGMGLVVSKRLAKLMGGDVTAISRFGKGSVFAVQILQKIADKTALGKEAAEKLRSFSWKETLETRLYLPYARVLVVDDVVTNHAVAKGMMKPYKMTVDAVLSGQEAIDLITRAEVHYDAIFMDHMMPGMDGMETTSFIRGLGTEYAKTIPIIALTANASPGIEEQFLNNGFDAFMSKPINANALNRVLSTWVRNEVKEELFAGEMQEEEQQQNGTLTTFNIEGVDLAAGAAQFGGEDNYLEIVKVFVHDTPKLLEDVQKFLDGFRIMPAAAAAALDALKNYTITVHGIKGSCYGICAASAGDLAKELEMAAKTQDFNRIMELNNGFIESTEKLVDELKILFPKKEETAKTEKQAPDTAVLQKLLDAAMSYNINTILDVLNELEQYRYQENGDLVRQLRETADNYEYVDLIKLLKNTLKIEEDTIDMETAG